MKIEAGPTLVVDAEARSRKRLAVVLRRAGFAVLQASTADEALGLARRNGPAAVLIEVLLRDASGYELCHELRAQYGEGLPIILLSGDRTEPGDRVAGLLIGADDYVVKPFNDEELVARVRRAVTRASSLRETGRPDELDATLTRREREILALLADGLPQAAIARRLVISSNTVATHIQRILTKLGAHSRAEVVALAYRQGLVGDTQP